MKNLFRSTLFLVLIAWLIGCASTSGSQKDSSTAPPSESQKVSLSPPSGSKFAKLSLGMGQKEVSDLIGYPTDRSLYTTGKRYIPFYIGRDTMREIWLYKGVGQLVFVQGGTRFGGSIDYKLDQIINDPSETGYKK